MLLSGLAAEGSGATEILQAQPRAFRQLSPVLARKMLIKSDYCGFVQITPNAGKKSGRSAYCFGWRDPWEMVTITLSAKQGGHVLPPEVVLACSATEDGIRAVTIHFQTSTIRHSTPF